MESTEDLISAIRTTPIIDNHAHPLLIPSARGKYSLLAITTEAHGDAMKHTPSTLSHIRAVKQLSEVLHCPSTWEDVLKAIETEQAKPHHAWAKRCLEGIETILIDDGLDGKDEVYDYAWHDKLCRKECKRIVRIEKFSEEIISKLYRNPDIQIKDMFAALKQAFDLVMDDAIYDDEVVGFKSVICYRTGLDIPPVLLSRDVEQEFVKHLEQLREDDVKDFNRLDGLSLNAYLVDRAASMIAKSQSRKKPIQFHVGLGDNDITLTKSSPSHLQAFIRKHLSVPIVLLHASYPWTKEAGYLASVYENVYADIGEVFPFLSKEGQENVVREILELCPTEKLMWSTDGHWFPETYLLSVIQVREAFEKVFAEYVHDGTMTVSQTITAVQDIFFNTSNVLYDLHLSLEPFLLPAIIVPSRRKLLSVKSTDLQVLTAFTKQHPTTKFLRLNWLDHISNPRMRIIPISRAFSMLRKSGTLTITITEAALGLLQNDTIIPDAPIAGDLSLIADFTSLRLGPNTGFASVYGSFTQNGTPLAICPRSTLQRVLAANETQKLEFLIGFEIEIVFMSRLDGKLVPLIGSGGHSYSASRALHDPVILAVLTEIYDVLEDADIHLEMMHPESASGQHEFVLPPFSPLEAADTLLHTREIIFAVVAKHGMRATLIPKPFPNMAGTASHVHMSISSPGGDDEAVYESFYAGILKHMRAIVAFTYSNPASYERMLDSCWAGGTWVSWGTRNKETALRAISGSHWEFKIMDGLANVYLALAAILGAGAKGIMDREKLVMGDCSKDPALLTREEQHELMIKDMLPANLKESIETLGLDVEMAEILGKDVVERYMKIKGAEMELFASMDVEERKTWIMERY